VSMPESTGTASARRSRLEVGGDVAVLIYRSGSTAAPEAVVCPHAQMIFAAAAINSMLGYRHDDVVFCRLPMSFGYGVPGDKKDEDLHRCFR
jgi:acyl-CoA synthetase (AMP-forming)/AMP-acid ligase II